MQEKGTINVQGTGVVKVDPDLVVLSLEIKVLHDSYGEAVAALNHRVACLRDDLVLDGIQKSDLKTTDFDISGKYLREKLEDYTSKEIFVGFAASHSLKLEIPLDTPRLNSILMNIVRGRSEATFSIDFAVKDTARLQREVLAAAVRQAKANATVMAAAAGVSLGRVQRIDYSWKEVRFSSETVYSMPDETSTMQAMPDLEPDSIECSENVTVQWEIVQE